MNYYLVQVPAASTAAAIARQKQSQKLRIKNNNKDKEVLAVAVAVVVTDKDDTPPSHWEVVHTDHNDIDDDNDDCLPYTGFFESIITLSTNSLMIGTLIPLTSLKNNSLNGKNIIIITHTNLNTFSTKSSILLHSVNYFDRLHTQNTSGLFYELSYKSGGGRSTARVNRYYTIKKWHY